MHLETDLHAVVEWADGQDNRWAFSLSNAAESYAEFRCRLADLNEVNWEAVAAPQWVGDYKAAKQAEFLVHGHVPWSLIERIGVLSRPAADQVSEITSDTARVRVEVRPEWYY